jgi:homoserine O-acetyltransferase/O-succinyltransferase
LEHKQLNVEQPFVLESGQVLSRVQIVYSIAGTPTAAQDNVIWICHALTANSNVADWWSGLVGEGKLFDPDRHCIICANILGSHYGTTGPLAMDLATEQRYYHNFPAVSVRDMVGVHEMLRKHLGIRKIHTCIGGSLGGQQALEWALIQPDLIENLVLIATNAQHSAWGIAFNESQRMAIQTDPTWKERRPDAGHAGMKTARSIALLSYRNYETYLKTQSSKNIDQTDNFPASSYQQYQGDKLVKRFNAFSYWILSKAMDSHNVGRGRGSVIQALQQVKSKTLVLGIRTDILFPVEEQKFLAAHIPDAHYEEIESLYGHDGFLIEADQISQRYNEFVNDTLRISQY